MIDDDKGVAPYLSRQKLLVADGHHRYETALAYRAEVRPPPTPAAAAPGALAADWMMAVLVNAARERLEIRPTHRLLRKVDADRLRPMLLGPDPLFQAVPVAPRRSGRGWTTCAMPRSRYSAWSCRTARAGWSSVTPMPPRTGWREPGSAPARRLDLALLHAALLGDRLGITEADVTAGETLLYTRSEADARGRVARGEAAAAILVRPPGWRS